MSSWRLVCSGLGVVLLGACAHPPATSPVLVLAEASAQRGTQALARGELALAEQEFRQAMLIHEALGDIPARAIDLLNLARVQTAAGQNARAIGTVQQVLDDSPRLTPATLITAHGRMAGLALTQAAPITGTGTDAPAAPAREAGVTDNASAALADRHLDAAMALCAGNCPQRPALLVLQGRVALERRNVSLACLRAGEALGVSPLSAIEQANALRLRAQCNLMSGQLGASAAAAGAALDLDRQLGLTQRVLMDLQLLVQVHVAQGDLTLAEHYRQLAERALSAGHALSGVAP